MENKKQLPLRMGVGIILLNHENNVFVGKRIDNPNKFLANATGWRRSK